MYITSVAGILSLLDEPSLELKVFALIRLIGVVDEFWPEISYYLDKLVNIYEDETFPRRRLVALILSKLKFHLGDYPYAASYALLAGDLFDVDVESEFVQTVVIDFIDTYVVQSFDDELIDDQLVSVIQQVFSKCCGNNNEKEAVGTALDSYNMDFVTQALVTSRNPRFLLDYTLSISIDHIQDLTFRAFVIEKLLRYYQQMDYFNSVNICRCLVVLNRTDLFMNIVDTMIGQNKIYFAYQMCFDLNQSGHQVYLLQMMREMCAKIERSYDLELNEHLRKFYFILSGRVTQRLTHQFLLRSNNDECKIALKHIICTTRGSTCHNATVIANSFLYMGSSNVNFLQENIRWFNGATNWAKFTAYASFGVICKGNVNQAKVILDVYRYRIRLPERRGGILFAAGLINADYGIEVRKKFVTHYRHDMDDYSKYGSCLGIGLTAIGTRKKDLYDHLMSILFLDNAVVGEAAAIALGLVMMGSKDAYATDTLITYAENTKHDKITQGIALALALIMFETKEHADSLVAKLMGNNNYILRKAAILIAGMAYCGNYEQLVSYQMMLTTNTDSQDEVKQAAVISLAFILFNSPEKKLGCVQMFTDSHNPQIRYASAIALGIMFAGSGSQTATNILEKMIKLDKVNFVRQGALIASSFILIQHSDNTCPDTSKFRFMYRQIVTSRHEDSVTKFGAILAQGIIDAGGRRVTLSLINHLGLTNMTAVAGMLVFTQYWNWLPLTLFLSLAFNPTYLVAVNKDFKMLKLNYVSRAKPDFFNYMPPNVLQLTNQELAAAIRSFKQGYQQSSNSNMSDEATTKKDGQIPICEIFTNPACFVKRQLPYVILDENCPFVMNKFVQFGGIVYMSNIYQVEEEYVEELSGEVLPELPDEEATVVTPEPFYWNDDFQ